MGAACWHPCRGLINGLDWTQTKAAHFANRMKDSEWETLVQCRMTARICAHFTAYSGEQAWKAIHDRLRRPSYLSTVDHVQKNRDRKQRTDIWKYSCVNRTTKNWNQLPAESLRTFLCKPNIIIKAIINGVKWSEVKYSDVRWNWAVGDLNGIQPNDRIVKWSVLVTGFLSLLDHTRFEADMAISFITFFHILLVLFCITVYTVVSFVCFCLIL